MRQSKRGNPYDLSEGSGDFGVGKFRLTNKKRAVKRHDGPYDLSAGNCKKGIGKFRK